MAMMKKQHFNPQPLLLFSFAAFLCPIIVTAGFQGSLDWESGLDEELYNLQSEPTFYKFIGLRLGFFSSCILFLTFMYILFRYLYIFREGDRQQTTNKFETVYDLERVGQRSAQSLNKYWNQRPKWKKKHRKSWPATVPQQTPRNPSKSPINSPSFFKTSLPSVVEA